MSVLSVTFEIQENQVSLKESVRNDGGIITHGCERKISQEIM